MAVRPSSLVSLALIAALGGCSQDALPATVVVEGRVFDLVGTPEPERGDLGLTRESLVEGRERALAEFGEGGPPLHEWDREDLAAALRPTILYRDGEFYAAREWEWEAADRVIAERGEVGAERLVDWVSRARDQRSDDVGAAGEALVIGTDGRTRVTNTLLDPFDAIARLELFNGTTPVGQCSGAYIGPWTLVTSAHCILLNGFPVTNRIIIHQKQNGTFDPGPIDCRNDDSSTANDILIGLPTGWTGDFAGQNSLDYAVIDVFPCQVVPNGATFSGYVVNSGTETYSAHGYPGAGCPGGAGNTFLCGMSGSAYVNGHRIETQHIDTLPGQSGGPWWRLISGQHRVAGMDSGYREFFDFGMCGFDPCRRNYSRRIDTTVESFIQAISFDF